jgi:hypothetical protein
VANEWNKTAMIEEFDAMLRRRLRSGAAPVVACAGFDLDAASAYLEDALGGAHRSGYESHLAGCATCRRHLIELARLAQSAPQAEEQPVTTPDRIPVWDRWKEAIAGWFDLSAWNVKWQIAAASGAAFAVLIAALGAKSLWRPSNQAAVEVSRVGATPSPEAELGVQSFPSPTPEASLQDAIIPLANESFAIRQGQSQIPVPTPLVGPKANAPGFLGAASGKLETLGMNQPSEARAAAETQDPPLPPSVQMERSSKVSSADRYFRDSAREQAPNETEQGLRIAPRPKDNPMNLDPQESDLSRGALARGGMPQVNPKPEPRAEPKSPEKSTSKHILGSLTEPFVETVKRLRSSGSPRKASFTESERKTKPDKQEESNDESLKPMVRMIRNKVFNFIRGMWIDHEYKPEMEKWRVWTLERDSEQYKKVLAKEPQLEEFFDNAPILVVWKDGIYQLLKPRKPSGNR